MAGVQAAQAVKDVTRITEHHSLQLTRNLLRIAIFHISYIRELFPEEYFLDTSVQSLDMKVKKLLPMDLESRRLIDWMEKGVYDALKKKYLKTMLFMLCEGENGPTIEEYSFSFNYSTTSEEISMHMTKNGHHKKTLIKGNAEEIDHEKMRKSACKMMRTLVTLMRTLDGVPNERTILVKLYYYDDVTPVEYEPPFFRCCTFDIKNPWRQTPFRMKAGEVNSKFITFSLKVKSTLDPCEDENNDKDSAYAAASTGACSEASSDSSDSDACDYDRKANCMQDDADNFTSRLCDAIETRINEDDDMTQDLRQETSNFETVKEWLLSRPMVELHITDLMANFPEISERHTEELVSRMVKENLLINLGKDKYKINRQQPQAEDYNEAETNVKPARKDLDDTRHKRREEDFMYLKALYYALPLDYVTISQLQTHLGNEINYLATRKLVEKMVNEGYVEGTMANRKIGRRVIHTEQAKKRFQELQETLHPQQALNKEMKAPTELGKCSALDAPFDGNQQLFDVKTPPFQAHEVAGGTNAQLLQQRVLPTEDLDGSTCGALQSFGSELTRHGVGSPLTNTQYRNEEMASCLEPRISKRANSGESHLNSNNNDCIFSPLKQKPLCKRGLEFRDSQDSFEKDLPRKASMVEEPIYQAEKRHRRR